MLKLLMVAHAYPPTVGGVETHLWDLSHELVRRSYRVHCLVGGEATAAQSGPVTVARHPDLSVRHLLEQRRNLRPLEINPGLLASLSGIVADAMERFQPDLVHLHNAHHFAPELALAFFQNHVAAPKVNSVHDRIGEELYRDVLRYGWAHTVFASRYLLQALPEAKGPKSALWLGIDLSLFSPAGELDERLAQLERPVIFHPARLLRWKGVAVGLAAFLTLRQRLRKGSLVLCASSNIVDNDAGVRQLRSELEAASGMAGMQHCVHFLDFDRRGMAAAYRASDLVWYPTIDEEALGLVPIEAMACGVPLIVSDSGGMRETVISGKTGIVVPRNDAEALASAAGRILGSAALRAELTEAGKRRAQVFDIRSYTTSLEHIYEESMETQHG